MVRIYSLALIALSASALAATTHNERRAVDDVTEFDLVSRSASLMDFDKRQDKPQDKQDSPEIQKLKDERKTIAPEIDQAKEEMKAAQKAAFDAIPADLKTKEEQARKDLKAAVKASDDAIPEELKKKEEDAFNKFKTSRQGLTEEQKKKLQENGKALREARKKENPPKDSPPQASPSQPAPAEGAAPAPAPSAAAPAPAKF